MIKNGLVERWAKSLGTGYYANLNSHQTKYVPTKLFSHCYILVYLLIEQFKSVW